MTPLTTRSTHARPAARALAGLAAAVALAVPVAACGNGTVSTSSGSGSTPPASSTTTLVLKSSDKPGPTPAGDHNLMLQFARCVRGQGISRFPNPGANGRPFQVTPKQLGVSASKLQAAERSCKEQLVVRGRGGAPGAAAQTKRAGKPPAGNARAFNRCMRAKGFTHIPKSGAGIQAKGSKMQAAARACKESLAG